MQIVEMKINEVDMSSAFKSHQLYNDLKSHSNVII